MIQKNIGTLDAYLRMTGGLLGLAYGLGKMAKKPHRAPWFLLSMSAMKVAEGATRFCPLMHTLGISTLDNELKVTNKQGNLLLKAATLSPQKAKNTTKAENHSKAETSATSTKESTQQPLTSSLPIPDLSNPTLAEIANDFKEVLGVTDTNTDTAALQKHTQQKTRNEQKEEKNIQAHHTTDQKDKNMYDEYVYPSYY